MRAYTTGQMTNVWTPRRVSHQDLNDDGQARRADRKRLRANLRVPVRYDPDRSLPDAADYESSDMEEDYMHLYDTVTESRKRKGSVGPEAAEAFRARRTNDSNERCPVHSLGPPVRLRSAATACIRRRTPLIRCYMLDQRPRPTTRVYKSPMDDVDACASARGRAQDRFQPIIAAGILLSTVTRFPNFNPLLVC